MDYFNELILLKMSVDVRWDLKDIPIYSYNKPTFIFYGLFFSCFFPDLPISMAYHDFLQYVVYLFHTFNILIILFYLIPLHIEITTCLFLFMIHKHILTV